MLSESNMCVFVQDTVHMGDCYIICIAGVKELRLLE